MTEAVKGKGRKPGRPKQGTTKAQITLRLDPDIIDYFRATGSGWQSRINQCLRDYMDGTSV